VRFLFAILFAAAAARAADPPKPDAAQAAKKGAGGDAEPRPKAAIVIEEGPSTAEPPPPPPVGEEKSVIGDYIRGQTRDVVECYKRRLDDRPTLQGKLYVRFYIGPSGRVIGALTEGLEDAELSSCVLKIVRKWEFDKPKSGGKLQVKYPFVFKPIAAR